MFCQSLIVFQPNNSSQQLMTDIMRSWARNCNAKPVSVIIWFYQGSQQFFILFFRITLLIKKLQNELFVRSTSLLLGSIVSQLVAGKLLVAAGYNLEGSKAIEGASRLIYLTNYIQKDIFHIEYLLIKFSPQKS